MRKVFNASTVARAIIIIRVLGFEVGDLDSSLHLDGTGGEDALGWGVLDLDWISAVESWNANPTNYNRERSLGPIRPGLGYRNPIHIWLYTVSLRIPTFDIGGYRSSHSSIGWDVTQRPGVFLDIWPCVLRMSSVERAVCV